MDYEQFITMVEQQTRLDRDGAKRATRATLETLAQRLSKGEARDLLEQLPAEMKPWIYTESPAEPFDMEEFLRRVAEREDVDVATADRHARAVFYALGRAVSADEIADVAAELPQDFEPLVAEAQRRYLEILPAEEFLGRVADRTGLDGDGARRATEAVLETLAERIAGGEVDDIISRMPVQLHQPLKRGKAKSHGAARRMSLDDFLRRVAEREGVPPEQAREHASVVSATLRTAIGDDEFHDITAQLPYDYLVLLARR